MDGGDHRAACASHQPYARHNLIDWHNDVHRRHAVGPYAVAYEDTVNGGYGRDGDGAQQGGDKQFAEQYRNPFAFKVDGISVHVFFLLDENRRTGGRL